MCVEIELGEECAHQKTRTVSAAREACSERWRPHVSMASLCIRCSAGFRPRKHFCVCAKSYTCRRSCGFIPYDGGIWWYMHSAKLFTPNSFRVAACLCRLRFGHCRTLPQCIVMSIRMSSVCHTVRCYVSWSNNHDSILWHHIVTVLQITDQQG